MSQRNRKFGPNQQIAVRRRPRQGRSLMTVDAILDAARLLLAKNGFDATSTTLIAAIAGVSVGSVYEYFTSKDALVAALIKAHCDDLLERYAKAFFLVEGKGICALVDAWIDTTMDAYSENLPLHRVLLEQMGRVSKLHHLKRVSISIADLLEQALTTCGEPIAVTDIKLASFIVESLGEALVHRSILYSDDMFGHELRRELKRMTSLYLRANQNPNGLLGERA